MWSGWQGDEALVSIITTTLVVASMATLVVAPIGVALGWLLARKSFRGKALVETLVALPLVLPPTAIGYVLLTAFARNGWLGEENLGFDPGVLFHRTGAVLAAAVIALPLVSRTARSAFESINPRLEWMARSCGLSPARVFLRVSLPLAAPGVLAACLLGFGRALGEFGATVIVAGNIPGQTQTLSLAIFQEIQLGNNDKAMHLVLIMVLLAFVTVWFVEWLWARQMRKQR
jgi:molybdate transport system permease protein